MKSVTDKTTSFTSLDFVMEALAACESVREFQGETASQNHARLADELEDLQELTTRLQDPSLHRSTGIANKCLRAQALKC